MGTSQPSGDVRFLNGDGRCDYDLLAAEVARRVVVGLSGYHATGTAARQ
jgi:hypothetical protein